MRNASRRVNLPGIAVVIGAILLWEFLLRSDILTLTYLPPPSEVVVAMRDLAASGELQDNVAHTLGITLVATALALVIGVLGGLVVAVYRPVRTYSLASIDLLRSLPTLALMPVVLLIWGASEEGEIIVATYAAVWPVLVNTVGAVEAVHPRLHEVATVLRLTPRERLTKVMIPAAIPGILVGMRLAAISAFVVAIVAEMIINPTGIGWGLVWAQQGLRPDRLFAYAVVCGVIGYLINVALIAAVRAAVPGSRGMVDVGADQ
jgi:NitT/TauT family transport system permease protein